MKIKRILASTAAISVILMLISLNFVVPVNAQVMQLPHAFFGNLTINGTPAPIATKVEAKCDGVQTATGNPIFSSEVGKYGNESGMGTVLIVQGPDIQEGALITFYINGHIADQTFNWKSGEITKLDLSVNLAGSPTTPPAQPTTTAPVITPTATEIPQIPTLQFDFLGEQSNVTISDSGQILQPVEITKEIPLGKLTISINAGTKALDKDGNPLTNLTSSIEVSPPLAPEGSIIYICCNFGPDGATFNPAITIKFEYNVDELPENVDKDNPVIAFCNKYGDWLNLKTKVDPVTHIVTADVTHFTSFAVLFYPPKPVQPEITPTNTSPTTSSAAAPELTTNSPTATSTPPSAVINTSTASSTTSTGNAKSGSGTNIYIVIGAVLVGVILVALLVMWSRQRNK